MEEIINSIMQTPENTNPNVLRSQLQGMASGSSSGMLVITTTVDIDEMGTGIVLDRTWQEIHDADLVILRINYSNGMISIHMLRGIDSNDYSVTFYNYYDPDLIGVANNAQDYPVIEMSTRGQ